MKGQKDSSPLRCQGKNGTCQATSTGEDNLCQACHEASQSSERTTKGQKDSSPPRCQGRNGTCQATPTGEDNLCQACQEASQSLAQDRLSPEVNVGGSAKSRSQENIQMHPGSDCSLGETQRDDSQTFEEKTRTCVECHFHPANPKWQDRCSRCFTGIGDAGLECTKNSTFQSKSRENLGSTCSLQPGLPQAKGQVFLIRSLSAPSGLAGAANINKAGDLQSGAAESSVAGVKRNKDSRKARCAACKKKTYLNSFSCECGQVFCTVHRFPEAHECTFDHKASGRKLLKKKYPKLVPRKIHEI